MNTSYWFKRKLYGWGWTPITWQGWGLVAAYIILVALAVLTIDPQADNAEIVFTGVLPIVLFTITLLRICYKKGPKPRWQWGKELGE